MMKMHPEGVELFHADGQTDMTKLIVTFRNFVNVPKKVAVIQTRHGTKFCMFFTAYKWEMCFHILQAELI
jgi:hypothetical protein